MINEEQDSMIIELLGMPTKKAINKFNDLINGEIKNEEENGEEEE